MWNLGTGIFKSSPSDSCVATVLKFPSLSDHQFILFPVENRFSCIVNLQILFNQIEQEAKFITLFLEILRSQGIWTLPLKRGIFQHPGGCSQGPKVAGPCSPVSCTLAWVTYFFCQKPQSTGLPYVPSLIPWSTADQAPRAWAWQSQIFPLGHEPRCQI